MSLLWMDYETDFQSLTDTAFQYEQDGNPEYFSRLSKRVHQIIYRDTRYNVDFLYTAYLLNDDKIMKDYAVWLYKLMDGVLKDKTPSESADYVIRHLQYIRKAVLSTIPEEKQPRLIELLELAQNCIRACAGEHLNSEARSSRYEDQIQQYMNALFSKNTRKVLYLIQQFTESGIPVSDIYVEILAESMRRIGELWHISEISVATEHYCTSVTQMAMTQMYPLLFSSERKNRTLLCACPGTELHEMAARIVADIFENDGWDTVYLGAAIPESAMMDAIRSNQPDLIALSVTMPQHLLICRDLVFAIRREFPDSKIAVGGKAFQSTDEIWKQWPIDFYTEDARELLQAVNNTIGTNENK